MSTVVDGASVALESITRHLSRYLKKGQVVRCRGTIESGAQCKRRPIAGSAYCFQHWDQPNSDGRLMVVIQARDKAARLTTDLSRKAWAATVRASSRLTALSPNLRAEVLTRARALDVRQVVNWMLEFLQTRRRWVTSAMVLAFLAVVPIAILKGADVDLSSLFSFSREIISRNPAVVDGDHPTSGRQDSPGDDPNASGRLNSEGPRSPGTDFAGAYVSHVEHLSADSSMLQIVVPAGVEGTYKAIVTGSEPLEFQCVILHHYTDRLYCVGARLPDGSEINLRIFRIDEVEGSQTLVFETNYTTGELTPPAAPSPVVPTYGGAFTWPDRFDQVEVRKEQQSSARLSPPSALIGVVLLLLYCRLTQREHRQRARLIQTR